VSTTLGTPETLARMRRAAATAGVALSVLVAVGVTVLFLALLGAGTTRLHTTGPRAIGAPLGAEIEQSSQSTSCPSSV
jgi:putative effector of murein hydrolase